MGASGKTEDVSFAGWIYLHLDSWLSEPRDVIFEPRPLRSVTLFGDAVNYAGLFLPKIKLPERVECLNVVTTLIPRLEVFQWPKRLQTLCFGRSFNQDLSKTTLPPQLRNLTFGSLFDKSLDNVTLPSSLKSLNFGLSFNREMQMVSLPEGLERLVFGRNFNQELGKLPASLEVLIFGSLFNQSLSSVISSTRVPRLKHLEVGCMYSHNLQSLVLPETLSFLTLIVNTSSRPEISEHVEETRWRWPSSLRDLRLYMNSSNRRKRAILPEGLCSLTMAGHSCYGIRDVEIPKSLQELRLNGFFNGFLGGDLEVMENLLVLEIGSISTKVVLPFQLPPRLQSLIVYADLDVPVSSLSFPSTLRRLCFGFSFDQSLKGVTLPDSLEELDLGTVFDQSLADVSLPLSLRTLCLGYNHRHCLSTLSSCPPRLNKVIVEDRYAWSSSSFERRTRPRYLFLPFSNTTGRGSRKVEVRRRYEDLPRASKVLRPSRASRASRFMVSAA